ncbi:MAG: hypothetical protein ACPGPC_09865 [Alphaproteobacteria bacterium]
MNKIKLTGFIAGALLSIGILNTAANADSVLFEDTFSKKFLSDKWQVQNDSADMRALDEGRLAIVTQPGSISKETAKNILTYADSLSEKNADIAVKLRVDIQAYGSNWGNRIFGGLTLHNSKTENVKLRPLLMTRLAEMKVGDKDYYLRIEKRNYKYSAMVRLDGRKWRRVGTFALLNKKLHPGLFATRGAQADASSR